MHMNGAPKIESGWGLDGSGDRKWTHCIKNGSTFLGLLLLYSRADHAEINRRNKPVHPWLDIKCLRDVQNLWPQTLGRAHIRRVQLRSRALIGSRTKERHEEDA